MNLVRRFKPSDDTTLASIDKVALRQETVCILFMNIHVLCLHCVRPYFYPKALPCAAACLHVHYTKAANGLDWKFCPTAVVSVLSYKPRN